MRREAARQQYPVHAAHLIYEMKYDEIKHPIK